MRPGREAPGTTELRRHPDPLGLRASMRPGRDGPGTSIQSGREFTRPSFNEARAPRPGRVALMLAITPEEKPLQ